MSSVLNMEILDQLREMLGDDFHLIIESFQEEGSTIIASLTAASESGDLVQMKEAAHSMKSMSGNVGAMGLSQTSDNLQIAAANGDNSTVDDLWPKLKLQYEQAVEELSNL